MPWALLSSHCVPLGLGVGTPVVLCVFIRLPSRQAVARRSLPPVGGQDWFGGGQTVIFSGRASVRVSRTAFCTHADALRAFTPLLPHTTTP